MRETPPNASAGNENPDELYTTYNPYDARDEQGNFDSQRARQILTENGVSYKEALETPNTLLQNKLDQLAPPAETVEDESARTYSIADALDENGNFDSAKARQVLVEHGVLTYQEALQTENSLLKSKFEAPASPEAQDADPQTRVIEAVVEQGEDTERRVRDLEGRVDALSEEVERLKAELAQRTEQTEVSSVAEAPDNTSAEQEVTSSEAAPETTETVADQTPSDNEVNPSDSTAVEEATPNEEKELAPNQPRLVRKQTNGPTERFVKYADGTSAWVPVESRVNEAVAGQEAMPVEVAEQAAAAQPETEQSAEPAIAEEPKEETEAQKIAEAYDLTDPVQMGQYRFALEAAGISTVGKDARALQELAEGTQEEPETAEEATETEEDPEVAARDKRLSEIAKGYDLSDPAQMAEYRREVIDDGMYPIDDLDDRALRAIVEKNVKVPQSETETPAPTEEGSADDAPEAGAPETELPSLEELNERAKKAAAELNQLRLESLKEQVENMRAESDRLRVSGDEEGADALDNKIVSYNVEIGTLEEAVAESETPSLADLNERAKKVLGEFESLNQKALDDLDGEIKNLQAQEEQLRAEGKDAEADEIANRIVALNLQAEALRDKTEAEADVNEGEKPINPGLDQLPARQEGESDEKNRATPGTRNWFLKAGAIIGLSQAYLGSAKAEAADAMFGQYQEAIATKEPRLERFEASSRAELGEGASDRDVARLVKRKEKAYQKSIGNTGWNHLKNLAREVRRKVNRDDFETDEQYDDAKRHKRKVILGAVALSTPVVLLTTYAAMRITGTIEHMSAGGAPAGAGPEHPQETQLEEVTPRPESTDGNQSEGPGHDGYHWNNEEEDNNGQGGEAELKLVVPGEYTADDINVNYAEYLEKDKVSQWAMGVKMDMTSTETAMDDMWNLGEADPAHAAQMSVGFLSDEQIKELGLGGKTPQQIEQALHDDATRAAALNMIAESLEGDAAKVEIVDNVHGDFYNWGARPVDSHGHTISMESAREHGLKDTELVQSEKHLNGVSLLRVTDKDGNVSYFNSECKNFLTEKPHPDVPVDKEPEQPPHVPTEPTEPTTPTAPTEPTEPTTPTQPTEPTEPTQPTAPTEPTEPTTPTEPTEPTTPTQPTEPTEPTEPTTMPTEPTQPTEPTTPTEPTPALKNPGDSTQNDNKNYDGNGDDKFKTKPEDATNESADDKINNGGHDQNGGKAQEEADRQAEADRKAAESRQREEARQEAERQRIAAEQKAERERLQAIEDRREREAAEAARKAEEARRAAAAEEARKAAERAARENNTPDVAEDEPVNDGEVGE